MLEGALLRRGTGDRRVMAVMLLLMSHSTHLEPSRLPVSSFCWYVSKNIECFCIEVLHSEASIARGRRLRQQGSK